MLTDLAANPGGFFGCNLNTVKFKANGNYFLLNHPNLRWVKTNKNDMKTIPNAISIAGPSYKFFFSRYVNSNNVTYTGKAHAGLNGCEINFCCNLDFDKDFFRHFLLH